MFLVIRNDPFADPDLVVLVRIVLALAVGILGATIPGFLSVEYDLGGFSIRAAGALALFVIVYFGTPEVKRLRLDPSEAEYLEKQSDVVRHLTDRNNCTAALQESDDLTKLRPDAELPHLLKGNAHYCLGQIPEALREFEISLEKKADYGAALYNKAAALIRLHDYTNAKRILLPIVEKNSGDTSARYNLAVAQALLKQYPTALENLQLVYESDPSDDSALGLGFLYLLTESEVSHDKASKYFRIAVGIEPGLVCFLYGQLPINPVLHEHEPYLELYKRASDLEIYRKVTSQYQEIYQNSVCSEM